MAYQKAKSQFDRYAQGRIYTPPSLRGNILTPGTLGGTQWHGGSFDPHLNTIYVNSHEAPSIMRLRRVVEPLDVANMSPMQVEPCSIGWLAPGVTSRIDEDRFRSSAIFSFPRRPRRR